jgi:hypothetical protein
VLAGRYLLGDRLGRGGMGTVWRARDRMLDREVAVKELSVGHLAEEDLLLVKSRMEQEARAAARIRHPGVITIHDVLEQEGKPWIVMEFIDGRSLAELVEQEGTLGPRDAADIGAKVLAALSAGHRAGVLHRDVKPANVLLERATGRVVLTDFGIATYEGDSALTRTGDLVGSPDYLPPERVHGGRPGPESDLWSLGATLFAAVEGQSPFKRDTPITTLAAVVSEPLPEPERAGALTPVLRALMAKEPHHRPPADQVRSMLESLAAGHTMGISADAVAEAVAPLRSPTESVPLVDRSGGETGFPEYVGDGTGFGATARVPAQGDSGGGADWRTTDAGDPAEARYDERAGGSGVGGGTDPTTTGPSGTVVVNAAGPAAVEDDPTRAGGGFGGAAPTGVTPTGVTPTGVTVVAGGAAPGPGRNPGPGFAPGAGQGWAPGAAQFGAGQAAGAGVAAGAGPAVGGGPSAGFGGPGGPADGSSGGRSKARPERGRGRVWTGALVGVCVVAVAAVLGAHYLGGRQGDGGSPAAGASGSASAPASAPASSGPAPAHRRAPGGYHWVDDPEGFRFTLPNDTGQGRWLRTEKSSGAIDYSPDPNYDPAHPVHLLRFGVAAGSSQTPLEHAQEMEGDHLSKQLVGYQRLALSRSTFKGMQAAYWSFSYTATADGRPMTRFAVEELVRAPSGTEYDIYIGYPMADRTTAEQRFNTVLNSFTVE